jgi:hypothetical protein
MVRISKYLAILAIGLFVGCSEQEEPCRECYDVLDTYLITWEGTDRKRLYYNVLDYCDMQDYHFIVSIPRDMTSPRDVICDRTFFEVYRVR